MEEYIKERRIFRAITDICNEHEGCRKDGCPMYEEKCGCIAEPDKLAGWGEKIINMCLGKKEEEFMEESETLEEMINRLNKEDMREKVGSAMSDSMIDWLEKIGYFTAPASMKHHGADIGRLYIHSESVAKELINLTTKLKLKWERPMSPVIIGFLHDVCKTKEYRIVPDEKDEYRIEWNKDQIITGHGTASVIMVQQFAIENGDFTLTEEEMMCIKFHMGAFTDKSEWEFYSRAIQKYPNVLYTHTADMIASKIRGV